MQHKAITTNKQTNKHKQTSLITTTLEVKKKVFVTQNEA
jgi:hypothetical protein